MNPLPVIKTIAWPPDYLLEKRRRLKILLKAQEDRESRIALMKFYKTHPAEWIGDFCVTFDPRAVENRLMPFVLFPRQQEFIYFLWQCLKDKENGLVEKCRDVGASWLCCGFAAWLWIFHEGSTIGFGSRKSEYVDKKDDPKAILPKIRQILRNLPAWMMPEGFKWGEHSTHMKITNPYNMASITGEGGDSIGRGGRTTMFFKDESAHYENPESIQAALDDNTDVQIDISSVNGSANVFYRRRMAGDLWSIDKQMPPNRTRVFVFDWRDHPAKTQEWYDARRVKAEAEGMMHMFAQEVDRDYSGSVQGVLIPAEWVRACIDADQKINMPKIGLLRGGQDVADDGGDKNALVLMHGPIVLMASHWAGEAGAAAEIALPICIEKGVMLLNYDSIGVGVGFKTGVNNIKKINTAYEGLKLVSWDAGGAVRDPQKRVIDGDRESPTNIDFFYNWKAQAWWRSRTKIYKTFLAVTQGKEYPPEELISFPSNIPNIHQLILELSQPTKAYSTDGRLKIDKKPNGAVSPNVADAFIIADNPIMPAVGFFSR